MRFYLIALTYCFVVLFSCSKTNDSDLNPAFLNIDAFTVTTVSSQGSNSSNITDGWVYVNDQLLGVIELPGRIPTLATGEQNIKIFPGIKNSGQTGQRKRYPFYDTYEIDLNLEAGKEITISPTTQYNSSYTIWIEDFEDTGVKFDKVAASDTAIVQSSANPFEGSYSGLIELASSDLYFEARTNEPLFDRTATNEGFPKTGRPVYLEMDYKTNVSISVGLYNNDGSLSSDAQLRWFTIVPNTEWNKIYIDFTDPVSALPVATEFDIFISVLNTGESNAPKTEIDNVKIIF